MDRLEYMSREMDQTVNEYDIYAVYKIAHIEQEIASMLRSLQLKSVNCDASCSSEYTESLSKSQHDQEIDNTNDDSNVYRNDDEEMS